MKGRTRCVCFAVIAGAAAQAEAHHSAAMFDTTAEITLEGTVSKYDWKNPHVYLAIEVRGADGIAVEPLMLYPVATVIDVRDDVARFRVDWMTSERTVHFDGRGHSENAAPSLHGHSIGHWEGDTLVVDTVQFAEHREGTAMGLPSGSGKHLMERFSLTDDRRRLRYEVVLEDPEYLAAPVTHASELDYRPDLVPTGLACDLDVARRFLSD